MKKGFIFTIVLGLILLLGMNVSYAYETNNSQSPYCFINTDSKVKVGKVYSGTISCHAKNGLKDSSIDVNDITVQKSLIKKVKILYVSEPTTSDGEVYYWDFSYKATFIGSTSLNLNVGSVKDNMDYTNYNNTSSRIKVSLFG